MIVELEIKDLVVPQGLLPRVLTGTVGEKVEEYKEMLEQGVEFDPITVWKRPDGQYWIVDGVHRTEAHKRAGRTTIKAKIVELKDELEYRIEAIKANLKHGLPLQKQEKVLLAQSLYKLGVQVAELKKLFGVAERTLYYWLEPVKEKEKEELKKKALELRKQGLTQEEVAEKLGVSPMTISNWEREGTKNFAKIAKTLVENNSQLPQLEKEVLEQAKKVLANPEYVFHTWRTLREDLARLGDMTHTFVYFNKEKIEEILHRHADTLKEIYKTVPEATIDALSEDELKEIKEKVEKFKNEGKWGMLTRIREEVVERLKEKKLRPVNAVVEELVKRVKDLLEEEAKSTAKPAVEWAELEKIAEDIERNTPEEVWEEIRKEYERQTQKKAREKKEKTLPPDIEDWYRNALEELLLDMGIKLGWVRAFEIADEIYQKVKEFSKKAVRGW
jgi:ParB-like chromosome segregation protein Spo0J